MIRIVRDSESGILRSLLNLILSTEGQDLIEYALVVALIAFAATAGVSGLATRLSTAFSNIAIKIGNYTA
jgi:pilus assembly protein Flp/PilA